VTGPTTNAAGVLEYNTHIFDINDGADEIDLDIPSEINIYTSIANSHVRKTGAGTLRLKNSLNAYRGTTTIRSGRLVVTASVPASGKSVIGASTNALQLGDSGTLPTDMPAFVFEGTSNSAFTFSRKVVTYPTGGAATIGSTSNNNVTFSGAIAVSNTLQLLSVTTGTNALFITGGITGPGGVAKTGAGLALLVAANSYTGATAVAAGTLRLAASERIDNASPLRLTGGTFAIAGFSETLGALDVDGVANVDFGDGSSTLTLADSAAQTWDGTLVLRNWTLGSDHLFIGASASLSDAQLSKITSPTGQDVRQLPSGEVVLLPLGTLLLMR
jgi:autotransporter-associated beta strand protein